MLLQVRTGTRRRTAVRQGLSDRYVVPEPLLVKTEVKVERRETEMCLCGP